MGEEAENYGYKQHYTQGLPRCVGTTTLVHSSTEFPGCWQQDTAGRYSCRLLPPNWQETTFPPGPASKTWESTASETCLDQSVSTSWWCPTYPPSSHPSKHSMPDPTTCRCSPPPLWDAIKR